MNDRDMKNTQEILKEISDLKASDIFVVAGRPLSYRLNNQIREYSEERLMPEDTLRIIQDIYTLASHRSISPLTDRGDDDFSFALPWFSRRRYTYYFFYPSLSPGTGHPGRNYPSGKSEQRNGTGNRHCRLR